MPILPIEAGVKSFLPFMVGFPSSISGAGRCLACPWLEVWRQIHGPNASPSEGILFLQDWGVDDGTETLESAVSLLTDVLSAGARGVVGSDKTLRALLPDASMGWNRAFQEGRWLIANPVWGLRPAGSSKDNPLPAAVHKAAFLLWKDLVLDAAEAANPHGFKLIVAGEWARFPGKARLVTLSDYLAEWSRYAKASLPPRYLPKGEVVYADHPSARPWNKSRFDILAGPP